MNKGIEEKFDVMMLIQKAGRNVPKEKAFRDAALNEWDACNEE